MAKHGKKYLEASKLIDANKRYPLAEAVELVKQTSISKFDAQ
jgi:large subunit ribosomal protein L1